LLQIFSIVGWVEVTKPFDYRSGQRPTSQKIGCWVSLSGNPTYNYFRTYAETGFL